LIEERDGKKFDATSVNPVSSTCAVGFTQTNPHISGALVGGTSMPKPSAQQVNHFHSRTTIKGPTPTFGLPQQTMAYMFGQGYTHTMPNFSMSNLWISVKSFKPFLKNMLIDLSSTSVMTFLLLKKR
jgi:hypothetical protein